MNAAATRRQLQIKGGVVKRLNKEHKLYKKEATEQLTKLDNLIKEGAEDWDQKNAKRMLEESNKMIDDSRSRLNKAVDDLRALVTAAKEKEDLVRDLDGEIGLAEQALRDVEQ